MAPGSALLRHRGTAELQFLAGLNRIDYLFLDPEGKDLILAGPAEPFVVDLSGRALGVQSGRPAIRLDDLIVGALVSDSSYIIFGRASGFDAVVDLPNLDSDSGIRLDGVVGDSAAVIGGAGDINQDGFDDVIVGASGADPNGNSSGSSYVVFGSRHSEIFMAR